MGLEHWLQLSLTDGVGPILARRMIDAAGSPEAAVNLSQKQLQKIDGIAGAKAGGIADSLHKAADEARRELDRARQQGVRIICPDDPEYPALLRLIHDPPCVLYVRGAIEPRDLQSLAIVGSRKCSHYGREQAERFAALLGGAGFTVVSGGARGVDSAAHRGAMQHPAGRTIAVLGCGVDVIYPPENESLFKQIAQRGAVISEFAFGASPNAENFPRRNRIVSGMSRGVFVIEADERSGALITARLANEDQGRPVFALPGRVDNKMSTGPHKLIRDGAILVSSLEEIIEGLLPLPDEVRTTTPFEPAPAELQTAGQDTPPDDSTLSEDQRSLLASMGLEPVGVEELVEASGLAPAAVQRELMFLTLKARVKRVDGQCYVKVGP